MKIDKNDAHTVISPDEKSVQLFFGSFSKVKNDFIKEHIILDFSQNFNITLQDILLFLNIASDFRENGISFVIVCKGIKIDEIPDEISVVPTMPEAIDVLEMDVIERDLMNF